MIKNLLKHLAVRTTRLSGNAIDEQVERVLDRESRNIKRFAERKALEESALFAEEFLRDAPLFPDKFALLAEALEQAAPADGELLCEFGVWQGNTINAIADRIPGKIYGFDSFEGLPEKWRDNLDRGAFRVEALPEVRRNVELIKGWFSDTLPAFLREHPGDVCFVHIDCDLYSSTRDVLSHLGSRFRHGTVLVFDEFFNYPGWKEHEHKAFKEFLGESGFRAEYIGYVHCDEQLAVRILKDGGRNRDT